MHLFCNLRNHLPSSFNCDSDRGSNNMSYSDSDGDTRLRGHNKSLQIVCCETVFVAMH